MSQDSPSAASRRDRPRLTVVLVAAQGYEIIQRTVERLRRQTIADRIELLVMASQPARVVIPPDVVADFCDVRIVDVGNRRHMGAARAEGIRQARADYVAMAEDHSFVNEEWAELLVAEHDAGAAVVGPQMENANPGTATSWAAQLIAYAPWTGDDEPRQTNMLPGHNCSYARVAMLAFGAELDQLMTSEVIAHWALHARGAKLSYQPQARCAHVNLTRPTTLMSTMYHHGRNFGAVRRLLVEGALRWCYMMAAPLILALRVYRAWAKIRTVVPREISQGRVLAAYSLAAAGSTIGETVGMAFGAGRSPLVDWRQEVDRRRFLRPEDQHLLLPKAAAAAGNGARVRRRTNGPVRVGLIGCGSLGLNVHLPNLMRRRDVAVTAIADSARAPLEVALQLAPKARAYGEAEDLIRDDDVEAVIISTPAWLHAELAVAAFDAGKHVYLEKPIATTVNDAEQVVAAWRAAGTVGMIGFNYRFRSGYAAVRDAIICGEVGNVVALRATFCTRRRTMTDWRRRRDQGGGALLELASHEIDLIHYVLGEPIADVTARVWSRESEDDTALIQGRTTSGVGVQGLFSFSAVEEASMDVYCDGAMLHVDRYSQFTVERRGAAAPGPVRKTLGALWQWRRAGSLVRRLRSSGRDPCFGDALASFIGAVRTGAPGAPDLDDGLASLEVVLAAEMAAKHGRVERVSPPAPSQAVHRREPAPEAAPHV